MVLQCGRVGSRLLSISEASITKVVGAFFYFLSAQDVFYQQMTLITRIFIIFAA